MSLRLPSLAEQALDPARSVVVAACAGSGKTWLLVSRILRLLLAGVPPGEILAITFTRYAAQEMATRLREWLELLAGADEPKALQFLRERSVPEEQIEFALKRSRALYEEVLCAQPGITISTFHSWYIQLLRSAPLNAGALGSLTLSEQTSALVDESWELFAEACRREPASEAALGLDRLFLGYGLDNTRELLHSFLQHRADWWAYAGRGDDAVARALDDLKAGLAIDPEADYVAIAMSDASVLDDLQMYCSLLGRNANTDQAYAVALSDALADGNAQRIFEALNSPLFTSKGEPRSRKPNKAQQKRLGVEGEDALLRLHAALCERMSALKQMVIDQASYRMHAAAFPAAVRLLEIYQQLKRDRQVLDFADVEWLAFDLMTQHEQAITLQFKLDSRYRHILLDEFQDTNPLQWLALKAWFEASAQAESSPHVFLVGDPKQAIYRFRRAEAKLFGAASDWLVRHQGACVLSQDESRRCAQPILDIVNRIFSFEPSYAAGFREHVAHDAQKPGRVEVLPLSLRGPEAKQTTMALRDPLLEPLAEPEDLRREMEAANLVQRLQEIVATWSIDGSTPDSGRPATYADIMILVRRRTHLQIYERALRHAGIPFVTSRRGGLLETLEVQDLVALLEFLVSPFDDLKLAHALRSPVFGCSDRDLLRLARADGATWWERLQRLPDLDEAVSLGRARALLARWLERADRLPVHDHLDKIYFEGDIERRYAQAVPAAVREAVVANLHAFIERALAVDAGRYPSLPRFLDELRDMRDAPLEEAPDEGGIDTGGNAVRILTVHGAKGLEAPIVWLLDAASDLPRAGSYEACVDWVPGAEHPRAFSLHTSSAERNRLQQALMAEEARNDEREDLNLLYVAMTRARQALVVSGCEGRRSGNTWYERIRTAVSDQCGISSADPAAVIASGADLAGRVVENDAVKPIPDRIDEEHSIPVVSIVPTGIRREFSQAPGQLYGTAFHRVMECLAAEPRADAQGIARGAGLGVRQARQCAEQALALLASPSVGKFFDSGGFVRAFNELPIVNEDGEMRRLDRVVEFSDEVWVLDYKTGRPADLAGSALEVEYRRQIEGYCRSLSLVYPGKTVRGALVFSDGSLVDLAG